MSADLALAEFVDSCLQRFPSERSAFLSESTAAHMCPSDHKHGETATCYVHHHCRCQPCRASTKARVARNRAYLKRTSRRAA